MAITTFRKISQITLDAFYKDKPSDDATYSLKFIAELWAMKIAAAARRNAFENSNAGYATVSDDGFISVYNNLTLQTDSATNEKYVALPAMPAALPVNSGVQTVAFTKCPKCQVVPMANKDRFMQNMLPNIPGVVLYFIEDGKIKFEHIGKLATGNIVSVKLIGATPGGNLLDANLNIPKDVEDSIMKDVLAQLNQTRMVPVDNLNDSKDKVSA